MAEKIRWNGVLISAQPQFRLNRSFDRRNHSYLGYALRVRVRTGTAARENA